MINQDFQLIGNCLVTSVKVDSLFSTPYSTMHLHLYPHLKCLLNKVTNPSNLTIHLPSPKRHLRNPKSPWRMFSMLPNRLEQRRPKLLMWGSEHSARVEMKRPQSRNKFEHLMMLVSCLDHNQIINHGFIDHNQ